MVAFASKRKFFEQCDSKSLKKGTLRRVTTLANYPPLRWRLTLLAG